MTILHTPLQAVHWLRERVGSGNLSVDSRRIQSGDGFIGWPGAAVDGRLFVAEVLKQGAAACLVEADGAQQWSWANDERVALYQGLKKDIAKIAALYYGEPSQKMNVLAVTGTNGKTSTVWWLAQALTTLRQTCGMIGTLGMGTLDALEDSGLTTPDPIRFHRVLRSLCERGVKACAVEASSIGIEEHRFDDVHVKVALLTNLTQDHLDYHGSMEAYWQAKCRLFNWSGLEAAVINLDDAHGERLAQALQGSSHLKQVITYRVVKAGVTQKAQATLEAMNLEHLYDGVAFDLCEKDESIHVELGVLGDYNVANMLGVIGALRALGYSLAQAAMASKNLMPVPGRLQSVFNMNVNTCKVVVDYAHTADALSNALSALRPVAEARGGKLWCVFGCGGDRDRAKRPLMGKAVQALADEVVATSDNPRSEDPENILSDVMLGLEASAHLHITPNRKQAISDALRHANSRDVVLLAGKGHESYQEIQGVRYPFSDVDLATQILNSGRAQDSDENMLTLLQAKELLQSQGMMACLHGDGECAFSRVHTDTRSVQAADLFVALKGENFDGHDFLPQAVEQGAVAVVAEHGFEATQVAGLEVADSLKALSALACGWRVCHALPVIAVTGSNGKTTTTQMIASILEAWLGDAALATRGNLNNNIGVPLSVLRLRADHQAAVFELGMNHPGEIKGLAHIVKPTVALVNNAQREHLEFMATVEAVAKENGQVIEALPLEGVAVLPAEDQFVGLWKIAAHGRKVVTFGLEGVDADYTAGYAWDKNAWALNVKTPKGQFECRLHCAGIHNVRNALAAVACAEEAGAPIEKIAQGIN
ncbi:MAG: UDP-N-acetylmuramoyl-L-alanyl-D-glutamate--2,6-diaminopimelate ligase, partial [Saezia sp.]